MHDLRLLSSGNVKLLLGALLRRDSRAASISDAGLPAAQMMKMYPNLASYVRLSSSIRLAVSPDACNMPLCSSAEKLRSTIDLCSVECDEDPALGLLSPIFGCLEKASNQSGSLRDHQMLPAAL
jgi:hypothetical protein